MMLHVHAPKPVEHKRGIAYCPTCKARRRYVARFYEWYGWTVVCVGCGDAWHDGERAPRPFARGWRAQAIAKAKREWNEIGAHRV